MPVALQRARRVPRRPLRVPRRLVGRRLRGRRGGGRLAAAAAAAEARRRAGRISCGSHECSRHGRCEPSTGACVCEFGWLAADCSVPSCPNDCSGHGYCVGARACACSQGWEGAACERQSGGPPVEAAASLLAAPAAPAAAAAGGLGCAPPRRGHGASALHGCGGHGRCDTASGACVCDHGWGGLECTHPSAECDCVGGRGYCIAGFCACARCFSGPSCAVRDASPGCGGDGDAQTESRTIAVAPPVNGTAAANDTAAPAANRTAAALPAAAIQLFAVESTAVPPPMAAPAASPPTPNASAPPPPPRSSAPPPAEAVVGRDWRLLGASPLMIGVLAAAVIGVVVGWRHARRAKSDS